MGDAEDIVQDAFLGLTRARQAGTTIAGPKAYLTTAVTRLGTNYLTSVRVRELSRGYPCRSAGPGKALHGASRQTPRHREGGNR